jgi:hypothetical protein
MDARHDGAAHPHRRCGRSACARIEPTSPPLAYCGALNSGRRNPKLIASSSGFVSAG